MAINFNKYGSPVKEEKPVAEKGQPVGMSKYGKIVSPARVEEQKPQSTFGKVGEFASEVFKGATKPVVELAARPIQLAGALAGKRPEETDINLPYYGEIKTPRTGSDIVKDIGRGVETVTLGMGGGTALKTGKEALKQTTKELIKQGAKQGAKEGALFGVGSALERKGTDVTAGDVATEAAIGGLAGGVIGGGIPAVTGLAKKGFGMVKGETKIAGKSEAQKLIEKGVPDTSVAKVKIEKGQVVPDTKALEAIKQGLPEADVALIKSAKPLDKIKMQKMLNIREKGLTNKRVIERATDVAGDTFLQQTKHIEKVNGEARKQLNVVAQRLAGKTADATDALIQFSSDMENSGIGVLKNGKLNFKGSDFEGLKSVQTTISNIWNRARRVAKTGDALQLHRMKSYIDEVVNYGKATEGLGGKAERILKGLRHNIDATLDSKFPAYNKVNSVLTDTITQLNNIGESMGKKFKIGDSFAGAHAGTTLRRIISNTQSRSDLLRLLQNMQVTAKKYGMKTDEDIVNQVLFSDTLEKMLGSEAPTSFLGQIERGVKGAEEVAGVAADLWQGRPVKAGLKATKAMIDYTRGINEQNKIKALRELLQTSAEEAKPKTVFGKIPKGNGGAQPPKQVFGAVAGIEQDDQGNIKFNPSKAAVGMLGVSGFTKAAETKAFKGFADLSTKVLEKLKGRSTVSKQFISDLTNGAELKQTERNVIRQVLETQPDNISVPEFAEKVKNELLPLKISSVDNPKYESVTLPNESRGKVSSYKEHIFESPVKTSAGGVHFDDRVDINPREYFPEEWDSRAEYDSYLRSFRPEKEKYPNYFGHVRYEDVSEGIPKIKMLGQSVDMNGNPIPLSSQIKQGGRTKTRRIIEVQSDLYQRGRLDSEKVKYLNENLKNAPLLPKGTEVTIADNVSNKEYAGKKGIIVGSSKDKSLYDVNIDGKVSAFGHTTLIHPEMNKFVSESTSKLEKLYQYNDPTAHFRMVREEVKQAAKEGKTRLQFPTGETAMKIEGLGSRETWYPSDVPNRLRRAGGDMTDAIRPMEITPEQLKVGNEIVRGSDGMIRGDKWIITEVLGNGRFSAVSRRKIGNTDASEIVKMIKDKASLEDIKKKDISAYYEITGAGGVDNWLRTFQETFNLSGLDTENPIYKFYEKDLGRYLRSKYNAKPVTDSKGVTWYEVDVKPQYKDMPVEAFGIAPLGLLGKSNFGKKKDEN